MKTIIFDTGPLISLTMNNLLWILEPLKKAAKAKFLITDMVKSELVDNPLNKTKRFMFEAMQALKYIENGTLEVVQTDQKKVYEMLDLANDCFNASKHNLKLVHPAEISALWLYLERKADAIVIDERTTRLLVEDSKKLFNMLRHNYRFRIEKNKSSLENFYSMTKGVKVIRSVELVTVAYEKGFLNQYIADIPEARKRLLESVIWGVKLEGCAVSKKELELIMRMESKL